MSITNRVKLTGEQHSQLQQALLSAFPTRLALAQMVKHRLGEDLERIAGGGTLSDIVFSLINWAEARGRTEGLIAGARIENPGNPELAAFAETLQKEPITIPDLREGQEERTEEPEFSGDSLLESCPSTFEDLVERFPDCAPQIEREELLGKIRDYLTQTPESRRAHVVLFGQPMVGKTRLLERLSDALGDQCVPLMVTAQGLYATENLDAFVFDLADQFTNKLAKWARSEGVSCRLTSPRWGDFEHGKGPRAFYGHWRSLQRIAGVRKPLVMFDEIEHLLDGPEKPNPRILNFLGAFVRDPRNGYFILAGSENIHRSRNKQFSMLIATGQFIRVPFYDEATTMSVLTALQDYIVFEEDALRNCVALCDGHPRVLEAMVDILASIANMSPGKARVGKGDLEAILKKLIERVDHFLWALCVRLGADERCVVWLMSKKRPDLLDGFKYSLDELLELADQYCARSTIVPDSLTRGIRNLDNREWVSWENGDTGSLKLKLGVVPVWFRLRHTDDPPC